MMGQKKMAVGYLRRRAVLVLQLGAALAAISLALVMVVAAKPAQAAFPGNNGKIVFMSDRITADNPEADFEIFMMNDDGTGLTQLTKNTMTDGQPTFSPDGTQIAFESNRDGDYDIYKMNAAPESATNQPQNLTNNTVYDFDPAWSPDGTKIAFTGSPSGNADIYTMFSDGSDQVRLTKRSAQDLQPAWSPDGRKIAFMSGRSGNAEIYVMKAARPEGKRNRPANRSRHSGTDESPNWSPDGTQIAFQSARGGSDFEIWTMAADGTKQVPLTDNSTGDFRPAWSPDGTKIAFMSHLGNLPYSEIYLMNALDGSNQVNITNSPKQDVVPDWQPIP
jgi:Tol biopolymer transport system component